MENAKVEFLVDVGTYYTTLSCTTQSRLLTEKLRQNMPLAEKPALLDEARRLLLIVMSYAARVAAAI